MMRPEVIQKMIEDGIADCAANVKGDDGTHFEAVVVAQAFEGLMTLKRHRMVYATLGEKMGHEIHALALRTLTPAENS